MPQMAYGEGFLVQLKGKPSFKRERARYASSYFCNECQEYMEKSDFTKRFFHMKHAHPIGMVTKPIEIIF